MTNLTSTSRLNKPPSQPSSPSKVLQIGLLGAGSIGRHHARVLSQLASLKLVGICDIDTSRGVEVCHTVGVDYYHSSDELIDRCDAVVVATPTATHFDLALRAIHSGKHLLVEKPLADSVERSQQLVQAAQAAEVRCVVGHVERFNPVVRWFRQNIEPSEILSISITRVGPRPPRIKDVGIVIDLAVHDIDLITYLCQSNVDQIQSVCNSTSGPHEDVAQIGIRTESGAVCGINTNWLTPYKSRKIEIATNNAFFVGDLVMGSVQCFQANQNLPTVGNYTTQTIFPEGSEPLLEQAASFARLINGDSNCENASVEEACRIVELAAQCLKSTN